MQKIKVSKDVKIIGFFVLIALTVGVLSWLLVKPERRTAGSGLGDYSPQIVQDVSDTGEYVTGVPGASTMRQNSQDISIKTDANNLMSTISVHMSNNGGLLPKVGDLEQIVLDTNLGHAETELTLIDAYSSSDVPPVSSEFYYLPGYTCPSVNGPAKPDSSRSYAIIAKLTRGKSYCAGS